MTKYEQQDKLEQCERVIRAAQYLTDQGHGDIRFTPPKQSKEYELYKRGYGENGNA